MKSAVGALLAGALTVFGAPSASAQVPPESDGALACHVKTADNAIMYWADPFPGKKKESDDQAFYFAEAIKKSVPGVSLGQPDCSFGFEAKYAVMYLDQYKHQHAGTFTKVDGWQGKH